MSCATCWSSEVARNAIPSGVAANSSSSAKVSSRPKRVPLPGVALKVKVESAPTVLLLIRLVTSMARAPIAAGTVMVTPGLVSGPAMLRPTTPLTLPLSSMETAEDWTPLPVPSERMMRLSVPNVDAAVTSPEPAGVSQVGFAPAPSVFKN